MNSDWQTWAALGVVIVTAVILVWRGVFRKKAGCVSGCGCGDAKSGLRRPHRTEPNPGRRSG